MNHEVLILTLGGTIAMAAGDGPGVSPSVSGGELVASVPQLAEIARIRTQPFCQKPGSQLRFDDIEGLVKAINASDADGVVVVQGTDTIEEVAFGLDCLLDGDRPVVVTGAMRNADAVGADGPANLLAAVQVAASARARGLGCLVVFSDEIHAARYVRKTHTSHVDAFESPLTGPIGWVTEGRVQIVHRPVRVAALSCRDAPLSPKVLLLTAALEDDGAVVDALIDQVEGIVVQGMGGGHLPVAMADALERAACSVPVILSTRCLAGEVLAGTYGFPGGELDLQRRGLVRSGCLDGIKSRVLLTMVLRHNLGEGVDRVVSNAFAAWGISEPKNV